jgi:ferredoxin
MTLLTVDQEKCQRDGICAEVCPTGARQVSDPQIKNIADWLFTNYSARKEPEIFI